MFLELKQYPYFIVTENPLSLVGLSRLGNSSSYLSCTSAMTQAETTIHWQSTGLQNV